MQGNEERIEVSAQEDQIIGGCLSSLTGRSPWRATPSSWSCAGIPEFRFWPSEPTLKNVEAMSGLSTGLEVPLKRQIPFRPTPQLK